MDTEARELSTMGEHRHNPHAHNNAVPALPLQIRDKFNRVLKPGDSMICANGLPPIYILTSVKPLLDPQYPPNCVEVTMVSKVTFPMGADGAVPDLLRVQTAAERGVAEVGGPQTSDGSQAPEKKTTLTLTDAADDAGRKDH